ncbi:M15 family metallopeptidase [Arthrobacter woluwensis]|uniref:M15 family metallopeptidase n=1 Tax=Arthrobacter woluwensis TaxID=156980 RepID=UPI001AAF7222|nr:M15 family metallopeptidase [Arthrobacter woluwensis]QTF72260.1 M15 family metallopeptidase [Arthrobacter woluwensis]
MEPRRRDLLRAGLLGAGALGLAACSPTTPPQGSASASPAAAGGISASGSRAPSPSASAVPTPKPTPVAPYLSLRGPRHSFEDPRSPWVVVNKHRPLKPVDFAPQDLRAPAVAATATGELALVNATTATAAEKMFAAASQDGVGLVLASGYRSYTTQVGLYQSYANARGTASADTASARPGYSEHQTGWAFDIGDSGGACAFVPCFASTPAAIWAAKRAHEFGFIVRYQMGLEGVTGYLAEPWHLRYIGPEAARDMRARGIKTLEQYFGLPSAPGYR